MHLVMLTLELINKHMHIYIPYNVFRDLRNGKGNVALCAP